MQIMERSHMVVVLAATAGFVLLVLSTNFPSRCPAARNAGGHSTFVSLSGSSTADPVVLPSIHVGDVRLFVGVLTASGNRDRRMAIRQTWGSDTRLLRVLFIVSRPAKTTTLLDVQNEATLHGDMVLVGHIQEDYLNITHQTLEVFRAASMHAGPATHVMKVDDDSYVHVTRLLKHLAGLPRSLAWSGSIIPYHPIRDPNNKWFTSAEEWPDSAPETWYAQGPGYVVTVDIAKALAHGGAVSCMPGPLFKWEDVAVGVWMDCLRQYYNMSIKEFDNVDYNNFGCNENDLVSHYQDAANQHCMYERGGSCCFG
jgi:hypothetical protein